MVGCLLGTGVARIRLACPSSNLTPRRYCGCHAWLTQMTGSLYFKIAIKSSLRLPFALLYRVPSIRARTIGYPSFPFPPQMIWAMQSSRGRILAPLLELYKLKSLLGFIEKANLFI